MSDIGKIGWIDLTIDDGTGLAEFYKNVIGWDLSSVSQGDYDDYCVHPPGDKNPVAGICHRRGPNESMPTQWMMYVTVANLVQSMAACEAGGGKVIIRDRDMGSYGRLSIIEDPAGAVCGIMQPAE